MPTRVEGNHLHAPSHCSRNTTAAFLTPPNAIRQASPGFARLRQSSLVPNYSTSPNGTPEAPTSHPTRYPATPQQQQPPCGFFLKRTIGILSFAGLSTAVFSPWSVSFCIRAPRAARPASPVQSFFKDLGFSPRSSSCLGCAQTGAHQ